MIKEEILVKNFRTNKYYFELMSKHNKLHQGLALEKEVYKIINNKAQGNILDLGCGEGTILSHFSKRKKERFFGIDISDIGIHMTKKKKNNNVFLCQGDITKLPYKEEKFDFIYSQSVIEHVFNYKSTIKEANRVLKKNGLFLITVSNFGIKHGNKINILLKYLLRINRIKFNTPSFKLRKDNFVDHMNNFDAIEIPSDVLLKDLKRNRFKIIYFTTRRNAFFESGELKKLNLYKRIIVSTLLKLPFFPFTHLGPTTIVLSKKI